MSYSPTSVITQTGNQGTTVHHFLLQTIAEPEQPLKPIAECVRELLDNMKGCNLFFCHPQIASFLQTWEEAFLSAFDHLDSEEANQKACDALALLWIEAISPLCPQPQSQMTEGERASFPAIANDWIRIQKEFNLLLSRLLQLLPQGQKPAGFIAQYRKTDRAGFLFRKKVEMINALFCKLSADFNCKVNLTSQEFRECIAQLKNRLKQYNARSEQMIDEFSEKIFALSQLVDKAIEKLNTLHREEEGILLQIIQDEKDFKNSLQSCEKLMNRILKL